MSDEFPDVMQSQEVLRLSFELSQRKTLIFREVTDGDWRLAFVNRAFQQYLDSIDWKGITGKTTLIGTEYKWLAQNLWQLPQHIVQQTRAFLVEGMTTGTAQIYEIHCSTRFGMMHSEVHLQAITLSDGSQWAIIQTHDLDEELVVRRERDHLQDQLFQARQMEGLGTFASGIAHDFNNLLMSILGNTEYILENTSAATLVDHAASGIKLAVMRARDMIRQIRAFSRRDLPMRRPVSLEHLLGEVVTLLQPTLPSNVSITLSNAFSSSVTMADAVQLHQVFFNLCTNAIQAIGESEGSVKIVVEHSEMTADDASPHRLKPGSYWIIKVIDDGIGMDEEVKRRAFEPFFTTKRDQGGTGLGLAAAYGIVYSHGGVLEIESHPGDGATFTVFLPDIQGPESQAERATTIRSGEGQEILVLDDDFHVTRLVTRTLQQLGYRAHGTTDALEALGLIHQQPKRFAMAIVDWSMPKMTGADFARAVREKHDLPMLLITGQLDKLDDCSGTTANFQRVLGKPFTVQELAEQVSAILTG